jgi:hypothetical protein
LKSADPRTIGNWASRRPGTVAGLAIWEPGRLATCGGGSAAYPGGSDVAPEWARVRRAGVGHDDPVYEAICNLNGGPGGCFDVIAWRGDAVRFYEYKGPRDSSNRNERRWIDSALSARVSELDLCFVLCPKIEYLGVTDK